MFKIDSSLHTAYNKIQPRKDLKFSGLPDFAGNLGLKQLNNDVFQKTITFGSRNKKPRELSCNGKSYQPDGRITADKKQLYQETLETVKNNLNDQEQNIYRRFFIDRSFNSTTVLDENGLPSYAEMFNLAQKLYDTGMQMDPQNPDRIAYFFMKDEITKSPEYTAILRKYPLVYNNKTYIPDGIFNEEKKALAQQVLPDLSPAHLNKDLTEAFNKFFIVNDRESISAVDISKLNYKLSDIQYDTSIVADGVLTHFIKDMEADPAFKAKKAIYDEDQERIFYELMDAKNAGDVDKYYKLMDPENEQQVQDFSFLVSYKASKDLNVYFCVAEEITGIKFVKDLYDLLVMYKALGMPLPNEINLNFEKLFENQNPNTKTITLGNYGVSINSENNQITYTSLHVNKDMFSDKFKMNSSDYLHEIFKTFYHEMGHHFHCVNSVEKFSAGIDCVLDENERKIFNQFNTIFTQNYPEFQILIMSSKGVQYLPGLNCFQTNLSHDNQNPNHQEMIYNMTLFEDSWNAVLKALDNPAAFSPRLAASLPAELIEQVKPVMTKLVDSINVIKSNLPGDKYALCSPAETIAEATKEELDGHPLSKMFRELLYKLGKPKAKNMSYLDERV